MNVPVCVSETASEGGAWGMAILASYMGKPHTLEKYLEEQVFAGQRECICDPERKSIKGFHEYTKSFKRLLAAERILSERD